LSRSEILRDVPGARIPGGSEDVLLDLSVRQLVKVFQAQGQLLDQQSKL
jgi:acyl-CoA dehydrogenase